MNSNLAKHFFFSDVIKKQKTAKSEDSLAMSLVTGCIYDKENKEKLNSSFRTSHFPAMKALEQVCVLAIC